MVQITTTVKCFLFNVLYRLILIFPVMFIKGRESSLNLDSVVVEKKIFIHRSDLFQNITSNDDVVVTVGSFRTILVSTVQGSSWSCQNLKSLDTLIHSKNVDKLKFITGYFPDFRHRQRLFFKISLMSGSDWLTTIKYYLRGTCEFMAH